MNPLTSSERITSRRGMALAEYQAADDKLPGVEELMKLVEFIKEFADFNLDFLLFGRGRLRKGKPVFNLDPDLLKKGKAYEWDEYLPSFIRSVRVEKLGLSQKELAEAMQDTGIYRGKGVTNFIYRLEQGATTFRFVDFISLIMAVRNLGYPVTFAEIFGEKVKAEEANVNLLNQRIDLLEKEVRSKDLIIDQYKDLLSNR